MAVLTKPAMFLELTNRSTNRIIFSAATDELDKAVFDRLWQSLGDQLFAAEPDGHQNFYEIRLTRVR